MTVRAIPQGYHTITPSLTIRDAARAIEFYQRAFGAEVRGIAKTDDGKILHAEIRIGDSIVMINDEFPEFGALSPQSTGGTGVTLHIYLENVDAAFSRALSAGASVKMPLMDAFWGDRYGKLGDPFGHSWSMATHILDLSPEEMRKAQDEAFAKMPKSA